MKDEFDNIVAGEEEIVPSSGFVASVMEAVRQDAEAPQPIAFPWIRALPGLIALGVAFAMLIVAVVQGIRMPAESWSDSSAAFCQWIWQRPDAGWITFALLLSLCSIFVTVRLVREQN
jgi:hypothetical protein